MDPLSLPLFTVGDIVPPLLFSYSDRKVIDRMSRCIEVHRHQFVWMVAIYIRSVTIHLNMRSVLHLTHMYILNATGSTLEEIDNVPGFTCSSSSYVKHGASDSAAECRTCLD